MISAKEVMLLLDRSGDISNEANVQRHLDFLNFILFFFQNTLPLWPAESLMRGWQCSPGLPSGKRVLRYQGTPDSVPFLPPSCHWKASIRMTRATWLWGQLCHHYPLVPCLRLINQARWHFTRHCPRDVDGTELLVQDFRKHLHLQRLRKGERAGPEKGGTPMTEVGEGGAPYDHR